MTQTLVNPVIDLLEADKPIFCLWANYYGIGADYQTAVSIQDNPHYDVVLYDLEHQAYDLGQLRRFMTDLLDPAAIATGGRKAVKPVIPRLPANGRELNEWVVKQVLDTGVAGLMLPHIETAEQALHAVACARYAQVPGVADFLPEGRRGFSPGVPARYWGLETMDYVQRSDVWGLDPDGELLLIFVIENKLGVENVREIAAALRDAGVKCILWAGGGDLSLSYGELPWGASSPHTAAGIETILAAGREHGLPVGMNHFHELEADYARGARAFFTLGPAALGTPPTAPEMRTAVGR